MKKINWFMIISGVAVGLAALVLTLLGNPTNMGFCIACFERDIAGSLGLHSAGKVQYLRPEIIGLVLGSFIMSVGAKEFRAKSGSSPAVRFVLGMVVMIGALVFLGCPLRMILRLAGGDLNALVALLGFVAGIGIGVLFLKKGFTLGRAYPSTLCVQCRSSWLACCCLPYLPRLCSRPAPKAPAPCTPRSSPRCSSPLWSARLPSVPVCAWSAASAT